MTHSLPVPYPTEDTDVLTHSTYCVDCLDLGLLALAVCFTLGLFALVALYINKQSK